MENKFQHWISQEKKTILSEIIVNFFDKLVFAFLAAIFAFWFNSILGGQELIGDYQKEIYNQRQGGYVEIIKDIKSLDRSLAYYFSQELVNIDRLSDTSQVRQIYNSLVSHIAYLETGSTGFGFSTHEEDLDNVLAKVKALVSVVEEYEVYFPNEFTIKIDNYLKYVMKSIDSNEDNFKLIQEGNAKYEDFELERNSVLDNLIQLGKELESMIRDRLKIEGIVLG
ncbi:MAG: hypothetical protein AAGE84_29295 [Cyanobacteria bacterium P01_G01_bin.39]